MDVVINQSYASGDPLINLYLVASLQINIRNTMSRFNKLAHSIWHCHYHVVWTPKYRFRILKDEVKKVVEQMIRLGCIYI